jgi:hypothetical protein
MGFSSLLLAPPRVLPSHLHMSLSLSLSLSLSQVYILEAHATDEWPIGNLPVDVKELNQHVTLEDRQHAFQLFKQHYGSLIHDRVTLLLDNDKNDFNATYPSWPFRVWIVDEKQLVAYKGMANADSGFSISLDEVETWLRVFVSRQQPTTVTVPVTEAPSATLTVTMAAPGTVVDEPSSLPLLLLTQGIEPTPPAPIDIDDISLQSE